MSGKLSKDEFYGVSYPAFVDAVKEKLNNGRYLIPQDIVDELWSYLSAEAKVKDMLQKYEEGYAMPLEDVHAMLTAVCKHLLKLSAYALIGLEKSGIAPVYVPPPKEELQNERAPAIHTDGTLFSSKKEVSKKVN